MKKKIFIIVSAVIAVIILATSALIIVNKVKGEREAEERNRLFKEFYDGKLALFQKQNEETDGFEAVFLGDSLTDGCDLSKYYGEYNVSNRGISGDRTYGLKDRMAVSAYDANPQVVVLLIGGNDVLAGKSLESIYANYDEIITGIRNNLPSAKIVWCSLTALGDQWAKYNEKCIVCNQHIKLMCEKYGCTYVDLYSLLCNVQTDEIYGEYTVEGVHFTHEGYVVVSDAIKAELFKILNH